jgi:N-methylhydantoinase B
MVNDPYTGGTHLNDIALIQPIFFDEALAFFSVVRAHWGDIGGLAPGSVAGSVDNIFHEGIRIPAILVAEQGKLNQALLEVIWANVRIPQDRMGDFFACISTCCIGERRLRELAERRSESSLLLAVDMLLQRAEERMRRRIGELPTGVYRFEDYIDSDGHGSRPLFLPIAITINGNTLNADFTGASPQGIGPMNCSLAAAATGVFIACKGLLDPLGPINQGAFRPVQITAPEGCFINARPPAACGGFSEIRRRVTSVTLGALARATPTTLVGDGKGTSNHVNVGCANPVKGGVSILYEYPSGGTGAFREADGSHACRHFDEGEFGSIQPVEVVEAEHPLLVERCELRADSEGAGLRRGGLGIRREVRLLGESAKLSILSDRNIIAPFGVVGGMASAPNAFFVRRNGRAVRPSDVPGKVTGFNMVQGDVLVCQSAGGGGYGDPLKREPERVLRDVHNAYITEDRARAVYGVVVRNGDIDWDATRGERLRLEASIVRGKVAADAADRFVDGRRIVKVAAALADLCGLADGDLLELVAGNAAPLRAWAERNAEVAGIVLGPAAREILDVQDGELVVIRSPSRRLAAPEGRRTPELAEDI